MNEGSRREPGWLRRDPKQVQEWLRQDNLIYGGLIAIGVAAGIGAGVVYSAGCVRLERDQELTAPEGGVPGDAGS